MSRPLPCFVLLEVSGTPTSAVTQNMDSDSILSNWYNHYMGDIISVFTLYLQMFNKYYSKNKINYDLLALDGNLEVTQMYSLYQD